MLYVPTPGTGRRSSFKHGSLQEPQNIASRSAVFVSKAHLNKSDLHGKLPGEINTQLQHRMGLLKSRDLGRWINGLLVWPQPQLAFLETKSFKKNFTATVKHGSGNVLLWGFATGPGCSHYQNTSKMHCTLDVLFDGCFQSCPVKHFVTLI